MKILLVSPLYPPDIAEPASYVKELASRLAKTHSVTVIAYAHLPEEIPGVTIRSVSKRSPLVLRLIQFTWMLVGASRSTDVIYAENGPSVELPIFLASLVVRRPLVIHYGDRAARAKASKQPLLGITRQLAKMRARTTLSESPQPRPEILPFDSQADFASYEASWQKHLSAVEKAFSYARER